MSKEPESPPAEFRFSVRRMLLLVVLVSIWLAGLRVLPESWSVWLSTAVFYLAVVLMFTPSRRTRSRNGSGESRGTERATLRPDDRR